MKRPLANGLLSVILVSICSTGFVRDAHAQGTLFNFFGIPAGVNKVKDAMLNRRGNHPGLERKPPMKGLADPAFLEEEIAKGVKTPKAMQEAAKVKIQEDLKPQKIKAIKYLASIGCGCYNDDNAITDALVEALGDCTEDVRLATVEAISEAAQGEQCEKCKNMSCCDIAILKQLAKMAYERDEFGCYVEQSERVREAAIEAMQTCCSGQGPIQFVDEKQNGEVPEVPKEAPEVPEGAAPSSGDTVTMGVSSRRRYMLASANDQQEHGSDAAAMSEPTRTEEIAEPIYPKQAVIDWVDLQAGTAHVLYKTKGRVPNGTRLFVHHKYLLGTSAVGEYEVVQQSKHGVVIRPLEYSRIAAVSRGDSVEFRR